MKQKIFSNYFTKGEFLLWGVSLFLIVFSFITFDRENFLTLVASLVGVTSLIFNAKGNPFGQVLMIIFSLLYGIISYAFAYYGEMITYLGMSAPMAFFALITWLKHPYDKNRAEVKVRRLKRKDVILMVVLTCIVTYIFYYVLSIFNTTNLIVSTISVTTSFLAVYLTYKRSSYYAVAYAANDIVLIVLWVLAAKVEISYLSVVICFLMFFINDIYGFINWSRMLKRQELNEVCNQEGN